MSNRTLRVGFIMGGGVSLGAFSGGALAQTLKLLQDKLDKTKYDRCIVDLFCGASAGSASLVGVVKALTEGADPAQIMEGVWVDALDIRSGKFGSKTIPGVLPNKPVKDDACLLNPETTDEIEKQILASSAGSEPPTPSKLLGEQVLMSVTLSNLNGYALNASNVLMSGASRNSDPTNASRELMKTAFFADRRRFHFSLDPNYGPPTDDITKFVSINDPAPKINAFWEDAMRAGTTSGAFPFAFPPKQIVRDHDEYGNIIDFDGKTREFVYVDGGVFNNEPFDEALRLSQKIVTPENDPDRLFIYIDPYISGPNENPDFWVKDKQREKQGIRGLRNIGMRLVAALRGEAAAKDWLRTAKYNSRVEWSKHVQKTLAVLISQTPDLDAAVKAIVESLDLKLEDQQKNLEGVLEEILKQKVRRTVSFRSNDEKEINAKVKKDYEGLIEHYEKDDLVQQMPDKPRQQALIKLLALHALASGTKGKEEVNILIIEPGSVSYDHEPKRHPRLYGDFLSAFGGFMDKDWREKDFAIGQYTAYRVLNDCDELIRPITYDSEPRKPDFLPEPEEKYPTYKNVGEPVRDAIEDYLYEVLLELRGQRKWYEWPVFIIKINIGLIFSKRRFVRRRIKGEIGKWLERMSTRDPDDRIR